MLRIGYVRLKDPMVQEDTAVLKATGCQVVRAEESSADTHTLETILDFIGAGDQLVVRRLDRLGLSSRGILDAIDRLEARAATLCVLEPEMVSQGASGRTLRAVLEAVAEIEPAIRRRRPAAAAHEIFALQRAGVGPVEIARRLGVSRMTVWRKLKAVEEAGA
jgi:DNA invertase Pin-like site-specific DNA recombinase